MSSDMPIWLAIPAIITGIVGLVSAFLNWSNARRSTGSAQADVVFRYQDSAMERYHKEVGEVWSANDELRNMNHKLQDELADLRRANKLQHDDIEAQAGEISSLKALVAKLEAQLLALAATACTKADCHKLQQEGTAS